MTGENGITRQSVQQQLISNPQLAQELGAFFAAERSTTLQTKSLGTFTVDGQNNGVLYGRLGSRDVNERMAGNIDMVPGNVYRLDADGSIDKNGWWFGGDVSPTDQQEGRSGSRLQVAVLDRDGNVIDRQNYRPGMEISTDVEGARLGFIFADGDLGDNSGHFNVNVRETSATQQATNVGIVAADADGIDRAGRTIVDALDSAPAAASLPEPDLSLSRPPAERGLQVSGNQIETTDGYRFQFRDNEVMIDWPGRHQDGSAETRIVGRDVIEGDGTTWQAENGNYVLPNGALFNLSYGDDGSINNFTLVHGDSRVDVSGIGDGDPRVGRVRDGGIEYRRRAVEDNFGGSTFRMGGTNDGWSDLDIAWNLEREAANVGRLESDNWILRGAPYVVDPELRPEFGTADYERMLRSEIEDIRSAISGSAMAQGAGRDFGRLLGDHLLSSDGTYDAYAQEMQASAASREGDPSAYFQQLMEQMWMEQMLGGIPEYHGNFDNAMSSLQMLQQLMAMQAGMQNEFAAAQNPVNTFIPNYQQQPQIDPAMLVDQILRGTGQQTLQSPGRNRLDRFDIGADRRARGTFNNDPGAALLRRQLEGTNPRLDADRERVRELGAELRTRIDGNDIDDDDVDRLASLSTDERVAVLGQLSSEQLRSLGDQLPDTDDEKAGTFLARLTEDAERYPGEVQAQFGHILDGIKDDGSSDSDDVLQYMQEKLGGGDVGEESHAQQAADRLANLGDENLAKMAEIHSGGNTDEKELEVIGRARGLGRGDSEEAAALGAELTRKIGDDDIDGDLLDRLTSASREDRLSALAGLSPAEREKLAEEGTGDETQMGNLMAELVRDAQTDPRAHTILRDFTAGIQTNGGHDSDDVLQRMQENLGGGDVENSDNRRRAARALAVLNPSVLDTMHSIHDGGNTDEKEIAVLDLARELQTALR
jgi:hypothetical protein